MWDQRVVITDWERIKHLSQRSAFLNSFSLSAVGHQKSLRPIIVKLLSIRTDQRTNIYLIDLHCTICSLHNCSEEHTFNKSVNWIAMKGKLFHLIPTAVRSCEFTSLIPSTCPCAKHWISTGSLIVLSQNQSVTKYQKGKLYKSVSVIQTTVQASGCRLSNGSLFHWKWPACVRLWHVVFC